jgi:hypothetical protein
MDNIRELQEMEDTLDENDNGIELRQQVERAHATLNRGALTIAWIISCGGGVGGSVSGGGDTVGVGDNI